MSALYDDLQWRGLVYQVTAPEVEALVNRGGETVYIGFDPTAESLHIGNLFQLLNLRRLQLGGSRPIALAGGATGMIGDPSFKSDERSLLDDATLERNVAGIEAQLHKFIDFSPGPTQAIVVNNATWTRPVSVIDFLRDVGKHFTVNTMIGRESVRARLEDREHGISFTEFSYGLLQAFDFKHLFETYGCRLQMGASDQWGNIVGGVDLIRRTLGEKTFGLCTPLVTKADGTKFGKTETGTIWLDPRKTSPYAFYQFFVRTDDRDVGTFLRYFTFLDRDVIEELEHAMEERPQERTAQRALAEEVTRLVHGEDELRRALRASDALYNETITELDEDLLLDVFADAPSATIARTTLGSVKLTDALVDVGLSSSKSAARTVVQQGGVAVNNRRRDDIEAVIDDSDLLHGSYVILRRGKREFGVLRFG